MAGVESAIGGGAGTGGPKNVDSYTDFPFFRALGAINSEPPAADLPVSRRERTKRRGRHRGHPLKRVLIVGIVLAACAATLGALTAVGWVVAVADSAPNLS